MTGIMSLWLPILLSAVAVFVISAIIHTVLPWHKNDYHRLPDEDAFRAAVGPLAIPPGDYMVPRPMNRQDMKSEAFMDKVRMGPNVVMTVLPNRPWSQGRNLGLWFAYLVAVGVFAAYVTSRALPAAPEGGEVLRFVSTTAFMGYAVALWQMSIWYQRSWSTTIKMTIDGLIYGLVTGAIFMYMWPG